MSHNDVSTPTLPGSLPVSIGPSGASNIFQGKSAATPARTDAPAGETLPAAAVQPPGLFAARISKRELLTFSSQLAIMSRSGVDLATAVESLARQCAHPRLKAILQETHAKVNAGERFSNALGGHRDVFGETYIASVAAGEVSGRLPEVLEQLTQLLRSEMRLRSTLRTLLAYPVLLTCVSLSVICALVLFVLPQFAGIFEQFETPVPALTQMLFAVATELRRRFWLWGGLFVLAITCAAMFRFSRRGQRFVDRLLVHLILVRNVTRALLVGRSCRLIGMMTANGVPLLESLQLARRAIRNSLYQELFELLEHEVLNGRGIGPQLLQSEIVPVSAAEMIATSERTGTLADVTQLIGQHYEEEAEVRLREIVTVLEPAITIVMGFFVAVIVLAVTLPMFDLATFAKGG